MLKNLRVNFLQSVLGERNAWDAAALNDRLKFEGYPIDMLLRDINELRRKELKLSFTEQKIDLTKSLPRNIISNRENFIKEIEKTWSQITKKQGKEFFSDPKALTGGLRFLEENKSYFDNHPGIPEPVQKKALYLKSLFSALGRGNREDLEDAARPFKWPDTIIDEIFGLASIDTSLREEGIFQHFGYRVGQNGLSRTNRINILKIILESPKDQVAQHSNDPGQAGSCARLRRVSYGISFLVKNAKRQRSRDFSAAISDWETDLEYLKRTYYDGRCDTTSFKVKGPYGSKTDQS